jgi:hypothetical protein
MQPRVLLVIGPLFWYGAESGRTEEFAQPHFRAVEIDSPSRSAMESPSPMSMVIISRTFFWPTKGRSFGTATLLGKNSLSPRT